MNQKPVDNQRPELRVRYTPEEFARLKKAFARTGYNQIGTYARKMTLGEPIEIVQRNGSFDLFVEVIGRLRKELEAVRSRSDLSAEERQRLIGIHQQIQQAIEQIVHLCMPISNATPAR
ncbi:MAG TPA: hypothetical protein VHE34_09735 [Puia sp.]|uniref:hypothetical protein n=1 Tax=Puia sp. TaxID=2045100 RepID=UPI002CCB3DAA|nr:hypothetical protein [Puia sp.]HVU95495.1 hypothetical protein [Puia sp.]